MPLPKQMPAKLSARAVYAQQSTSKEALKKGRGRPKKIPIPTKKLKTKTGQKPKKHKSLIKSKQTTESIEHDSSLADLSSEAEETYKGELPDVKKVKRKVSAKPSDVEIEQQIVSKSDDDEESGSGEEEDLDYADEGLDSGESNEDPAGELVDGKVKNGEETSTEEDILYSLPDSWWSAEEQATDVKAEVNEEKKIEKTKIESKKKRPVEMEQISKDENEEEVENVPKPKKKKRKVKREELDHTETPSTSNMVTNNTSRPLNPVVKVELDEDLRMYEEPCSSHRVSFSQSRASSSSRRPTFHVPISPRIHTMDSLIKSKMVHCGNVAADKAFQWLIAPTTPHDFFGTYFEKTAYPVHRQSPDYFAELFSGNDINTMLKENHLEYGVHIDVVKYTNGVKQPIEGEGRAYYSNVWEDFKQGYSVRVRNPQTYNKNLWNMCSLLQEYFSSTVGVNLYLTPPKAQGFPPHYDDIDAFIVQIEGRKLWKVYSPRSENEELARYSSRDFDQDEIGSPLLEICMNAGDMLYIPRGFIHQAMTGPVHHSLHLTFSTNQRNTWGDLMVVAARKAVEAAILNNVEFRESLPKDYMDHIGKSVVECNTLARFEIIHKVKLLSKKIASLVDVDEAADLHSLKFIKSSLPPIFNKLEKERSLHGNGSYWKNGEVRVKGIINLDTQIQLIKKRNLRLVIEDDSAKLYHNLENPRDPQNAENGAVASYVDLDIEGIDPYLFLQKRFPHFVKVRDLPIEEREDRISFATSLYENGLIMTKDPLPRLNDESFDWTTIPDISIVKRERP